MAVLISMYKPDTQGRVEEGRVEERINVPDNLAVALAVGGCRYGKPIIQCNVTKRGNPRGALQKCSKLPD